ncbi:hypothetical protein JCM8547_001320 [Rhodosporidiobolus lusitaniae]
MLAQNDDAWLKSAENQREKGCGGPVILREPALEAGSSQSPRAGDLRGGRRGREARVPVQEWIRTSGTVQGGLDAP